MKIKNRTNIIFMTAITALFLAIGVQCSSSAMAFNIPSKVIEASNFANSSVSGEVIGYVVRDGNKIRATNVSPGEVILWEMTLHNDSLSAVKNIKVDGDIPQGTVFVANSASGGEFSLDGNSFSRAPLMRDSQGRLVSAPVSAYKAIRFTVSLAPNETKTFTYKTTVK